VMWLEFRRVLFRSLPGPLFGLDSKWGVLICGNYVAKARALYHLHLPCPARFVSFCNRIAKKSYAFGFGVVWPL